MQRFIFVFVVLCVILFGIGFFIWHKPVVNRQSSAVFAPSPSLLITQESPKTAQSAPSIQWMQMPFSLNIPAGFKMGLLGQDVGIRDLAISDEGVVLGSSPSLGELVGFKIRNDGTIEKKTIVSHLHSPHGIAFYQGKLFVAEDNRLSRYSWNGQDLSAAFEKELMKLPSGGHDAHTLVFDQEGNLFVKVGSSCNVCIESDPLRATVIKTDQEGNNPTIFAKGLRNAAFMTLNQDSGEIYVSENGRDNLGDNLPPEEINLLKKPSTNRSDPVDYGWPFCYGNRVHDQEFDKKTYIKDPCQNTEPPVFEMQAHVAPLGLTFIPQSFSENWKGDLLVAFHGSWNRSVPTGYTIVRIHRENGKFVSQEDFIGGFLAGGKVLGRPVDLEFDKNGNLFISDDKAGNIYVVQKK